MSNKYESLDTSLRAAGYFTTGIEFFGKWDRVTVCSRKLPGGVGYSGNSFWVSVIGREWIIGTWGGISYRVPNPENLAALCVKWLARYPDDVKTDFDDDIKLEFNLKRV